MPNLKIIKILFISCLVFLIPSIVSAALLYLDPNQGEFGQGDNLIVKVRLDNQGQCINALDVQLKFSENIRLVDFSIGNSIINIWIDKPDSSDMNKINMDRTINFSGGIPGGYCGMIKGDQGESNILAELIFTVAGNYYENDLARNRLQIDFVATPQVLLNDGKGTPAVVSMHHAAFSLVKDKQAKDNAWLQRLEEDGIPPEPFIIELLKDQRVFDGKYFIIFDAQDKQTGIDHYEVLEIEPGKELEGQQNRNNIISRLIKGKVPQWKIAQSPYLLEDQKLQSEVHVKALDKAGNERTVKYFPKQDKETAAGNTLFTQKNLLLLSMAIILILLGSATIHIARTRIISKQKNNEKE